MTLLFILTSIGGALGLGLLIGDISFKIKLFFMKNKMAATSLAAHDAVHPDMLSEHYKRITQALMILGEANYSKIAEIAGFDNSNQVSRRLKEMEGNPEKNKPAIVIKTGRTSKTKSGREANNYTLCIKGDIV